MPFLFAIQTIFSLWLVSDAMKRRAGCHWYWIIMMPFGEWVYFFTVKIHDPEFRRVGERLLQKPVSIKELQYQARTSPSLHNKLLLAQATHDGGEFQEAIALFEEVASRDPENKKALYGLGVSYLAVKKVEKAIGILEQLVEEDFSYKDYDACLSLAEAYSQNAQPERAAELLEKVVHASNRISHSTALAKQLVALERDTQARIVIDEAIESYENSPRHIRRVGRDFAKEAKRIQRSL